MQERDAHVHEHPPQGGGEFPLTSSKVRGSLGLLDNPSSATKYFQAVKKASTVLGYSLPSAGEMALVRAGTRKFLVPGEESFLHGQKVDVLVRDRFDQGRGELAKFLPVAYTFQLRVQSEGLELGLASEQELQRGKDGAWHSHVVVEQSGAVTIRLRRRKNKQHPSSITRRCICEIWRPKLVCGVCVLKKLLREKEGTGRLFPQTRNTDVRFLKEIASRKELGSVTWHGFRRGRTEDVVAGLDVKDNPAASLVEIAETLGHNMRRASFFQYLHGKTASRKTVRRLCEDTESE